MSVITGTSDRRQFRIVLMALLVALFLSALDNTIVATAMPTIVGKLGGFAKYTWVTTAYVVTTTISTLLLGKLSDLYGRRKLFLFSIAVFIIGSAMCGAARNIDQLITFRALQGIGGGGISGLTFTIIADLVPPAGRGRYFGLFTSVYAVASLAGPLIGGALVDHLSWRWIFYVNLPLGALVLVSSFLVLRLPASRSDARLDWQGAVLVSAAIAAFMVALEQGDQRGWRSGPILAMFALCLALTVAFVMWERRAPEPVMPMHFFANPILRSSFLLAVFAGFTVMSVGLFFALYFQDVRFHSPTKAGLLTFPLIFGVTVAATVSGKVIGATGKYKILPLIGCAVSMAGMLVSTQLNLTMPYVLMGGAMLTIGLGMGLTMPTISIATQNAGDPRDMGIVTASATFFRTLGSAIGLAIYGAVLTASLKSELARRLPGQADALTTLVRAPEQIKALPAATRDAVQSSITFGITRVFILAAAAMIFAFASAVSLREMPLRRESGIDARAALAEI